MLCPSPNSNIANNVPEMPTVTPALPSLPVREVGAAPKRPYIRRAAVTEHQPAPGPRQRAVSHVSPHPFRKELIQELGLIRAVCAALTPPEPCNYLVSVIS